MSKAPTYRWSVTDHRKGGRWHGHAAGQAEAQAAVVKQLRRIGRALNGVSATIFRPSGGGWFCRGGGRERDPYTWEAWEQERA